MMKLARVRSSVNIFSNIRTLHPGTIDESNLDGFRIELQMPSSSMRHHFMCCLLCTVKCSSLDLAIFRCRASI